MKYSSSRTGMPLIALNISNMQNFELNQRDANNKFIIEYMIYLKNQKKNLDVILIIRHSL